MSFSNTNTGDQPANPIVAKSKGSAPTKEKVDELSTFVDKCKFAMMTTHTGNGLLVSRCMAVGAKESGGVDILFFTNTESGKTDDLDANPMLNIAFLDATGQWASISGTAIIDTDRAIIKKHYTQQLKTWMGDLGDGKHDGGPDDPRIGAIRVKAKTITYSLFNKNIVSRTVEIAKGSITGDTPDFNYIRELDEAELEQWRMAAN